MKRPNPITLNSPILHILARDDEHELCAIAQAVDTAVRDYQESHEPPLIDTLRPAYETNDLGQLCLTVTGWSFSSLLAKARFSQDEMEDEDPAIKARMIDQALTMLHAYLEQNMEAFCTAVLGWPAGQYMDAQNLSAEQRLAMRMPTDEEWDHMLRLGADNERIHWVGMYSHITGPAPSHQVSGELSIARGCHSAAHFGPFHPAGRFDNLGFRPVVTGLSSDIQPFGDDLYPIGTLYMDHRPVHIPHAPHQCGDVVEYIQGAKLEMGKPLDDPAYQIPGIHLGKGIFIADRVILNHISFQTLKELLSQENG